jgi:flagellar biosynthesis protein
MPREIAMPDKPRTTLPKPGNRRSGAVALSLGTAGQAPTVVAKGYGAVAEAIVQRARDSGLYVHASPNW